MQLTKDIIKHIDISQHSPIVLGWDDASAIKAEYDLKVVEGSEIKGFRKGRAPLNVCIAKIGRDKYYREMREYIASKALTEALKGTDISPVVQLIAHTPFHSNSAIRPSLPAFHV